MLRWPLLERIPLGGDLGLSPHAVGIALGFVAAAYVMRAVSRSRGLTEPERAIDVDGLVQDLVVRSALAAIVGARLVYVATHLDRYQAAPLDVVRFSQGGLSFLGGLLAAVLVAVPWMRRAGLDRARTLDAGAPAVTIGLLFGRLGDLTIGDHIGGLAPAGWPLAWRCTGIIGGGGPRPYPQAGPAPTLGCFDVAVHQTALYDGLAALVVLGALWIVARRTREPGALAVTFVCTYAPLRALGDLARADRRLAGLTVAQWTLVVLVTATVVGWRRRRRPADSP